MGADLSKPLTSLATKLNQDLTPRDAVNLVTGDFIGSPASPHDADYLAVNKLVQGASMVAFPQLIVLRSLLEKSKTREDDRLKNIETYRSPHVNDEDRARAREAIKEDIRRERKVIDRCCDDGSRSREDGAHVMCLNGGPDYRILFQRWPGELVDEVLCHG